MTGSSQNPSFSFFVTITNHNVLLSNCFQIGDPLMRHFLSFSGTTQDLTRGTDRTVSSDSDIIFTEDVPVIY